MVRKIMSVEDAQRIVAAADAAAAALPEAEKLEDAAHEAWEWAIKQPKPSGKVASREAREEVDIRWRMINATRRDADWLRGFIIGVDIEALEIDVVWAEEAFEIARVSGTIWDEKRNRRVGAAERARDRRQAVLDAAKEALDKAERNRSPLDCSLVDEARRIVLAVNERQILRQAAGLNPDANADSLPVPRWNKGGPKGGM
jgi:hypothetical protein